MKKNIFRILFTYNRMPRMNRKIDDLDMYVLLMN